MYAQIVPKIPTGTLIQKTARQSIAASSPPNTSPTNCPAMAETWLIPVQSRVLLGEGVREDGGGVAVSIEPPSAWMKRQPISHMAALAPR